MVDREIIKKWVVDNLVESEINYDSGKEHKMKSVELAKILSVSITNHLLSSIPRYILPHLTL